MDQGEPASAWVWKAARRRRETSPGLPPPTGRPSMLTTGMTMVEAPVIIASRAARASNQREEEIIAVEIYMVAVERIGIGS